jgi:UDP-N-acetylmuramoyl-L-alanyl-D-glutamate--2,6-diaminopimelate ligase
MLWQELTANFEVVESGGKGNPMVGDIVYDSREVSEESVFVAIPGVKHNGETFIDRAVESGACAVISQSSQPRLSVPWVKVRDARVALGTAAKALWDTGRDITTVGITGTNGKTTTAVLVRSLLSGTLAQPDSVWLYGTVGYCYDGATHQAPTTTPAAADMLRQIARARTHPSALVMEVSSHALQLDRVAGLDYDVAVWTNLTQDHLDFHRTVEEYYQAKQRLFTRYLKDGGYAVINTDDPWGRKLSASLTGKEQISYGEGEDARVRVLDWRGDLEGSVATVAIDGSRQQFRTPLFGAFNRYNLAALCAVARALSLDPGQIQSALDSVERIPGRMERVRPPHEFAAIVDYAHTPDALDKALATAREITPGRLICVFGCGGDRDRTKRPLMARAVARYSDQAIVTSDNPRSENPERIIDEILTGMPLDFACEVCVDRREAIGKALALAGEGGCVVIAGKGHEDYQEIQGMRHHFDDREVVREEYQRLARVKR